MVFPNALFDAPQEKRKSPVFVPRECPQCYQHTRPGNLRACAACLARNYAEENWRHCLNDRCNNFIVRRPGKRDDGRVIQGKGPYCSRECFNDQRERNFRPGRFQRCARDACCNFFTRKGQHRFCSSSCGHTKFEKNICYFCQEPVKKGKIHRRCQRAHKLKHCKNEGCYNFFMQPQLNVKEYCCHPCSKPAIAAASVARYEDPQYREQWAAAHGEVMADPEQRARRSKIQQELWSDPEHRARRLEAMQEGARNMTEEQKLAKYANIAAAHSTPAMIARRMEISAQIYLDKTPEERAIFRHQHLLRQWGRVGPKQPGSGLKGAAIRKLRKQAREAALTKLAKLDK